MNQKPKLVILGMGFLMEHLKPCYHHLYGEDLSPYIAASTHSAQRAPQRAKQMGFPVVCQGELELLRAHQPELILFAPIPTAAPGPTKAKGSTTVPSPSAAAGDTHAVGCTSVS